MPSTDPMAALTSARRMALGEQLARAARKSPGHVAFRFEALERTFAELDERVTRLARALAGRGVGRGDRVAVLMTNRLEVVESYLAGCRLGAIVVPVNFRLVADEVVYIVRDSGSKVLLVDRGLAALAADVRAQVPELGACLVTGGDEAAAGPGAEDYEA